MKKYIPSEIEKKWKKKWAEDNLYASDLNPPVFDPKAQTRRAGGPKKHPKKHYVLAEFAYSSGDLHMGHWFTFSGADIYARFKRMQGYNVFFPNGFDSFGLPAENAAIKRGIHPREWTLSNIEAMKGQFGAMGASFSFDHQVVTCDPLYYKWNQWIFLKLYDKGLAYRGKAISNWCESCQTVLAHEAVEAGKCWRCGTQVIQKEVNQWFFKITDYAEKLIWPDPSASSGLSVNWPQSVREGQNSWIGRSEGTIIRFQISDFRYQIEVFTVYPETIYGVTFMVLAPEHPLVDVVTTAEQKEFVRKYVEEARKKSELERKMAEREKTGVFTGAYCINPINKQHVPIWVADYVISTYGTGAVMGVPGSDHRDFAFAKRYGIEIRQVIVSDQAGPAASVSQVRPRSANKPAAVDARDPSSASPALNVNQAYEGEGVLINSGQFSGLKSDVARSKITDYIEKQNIGSRQVQYHLRDWSVSRQRYWGTPVPMVHCQNCGMVPVDDVDLPVMLPFDVDYTPKGKPPLATNDAWLKVKCPKCDGDATRDAETLDAFVDSSWYFFRYLSPSLTSAPFDTEIAKKIMPVDIYFGGAEHTLGHTLYSRFISKFFKDLNLISFDEYALRRINHGVILGPDGARMSKSRGNVVNPDEEVKKYGADSVRVFLAFFMPYDGTGPWVSERLWGSYRFLDRVWGLFQHVRDQKSEIGQDSSDIRDLTSDDLRMMHKTIKHVGEDIENIKFNTAVAALMEWLNYLGKKGKVEREEYKTLLLLLAPFAPHLTEELWQMLQLKTDNLSIHAQPWPKYDEHMLDEEEVTIIVQIDGKLRDELLIQKDIVSDYKVIEKMALDRPKVQKFLSGRVIKNIVYIPVKIINIVTKVESDSNGFS